VRLEPGACREEGAEATHAGIAWATARREEQLEEALRTRDLIGQAKGMLMCEHDIGEDEAFDMLRDWSQRANVKLRDLAQRLVAGERDIVS
jgi:AmiR/NasT family two-component response regulator